jgi:hypothetical protein
LGFGDIQFCLRARSHKITICESATINVRFGSVCGLKTDIFRNPRSVDCVSGGTSGLKRFRKHVVILKPLSLLARLFNPVKRRRPR